MARFEQVNYSGPMPKRFVDADENYIKQQLMRLPTNLLRAKVAMLYVTAFEKAYNAESVEFRQENAARHDANKRLREFIDKQIPYMNGRIDADEDYTG